ncbi:unnamed protein product, partial [Fusarium graminearum]
MRPIRSNTGLQSAESSDLMTTQRRLRRKTAKTSSTESLRKRDASESLVKSRGVKLDRRRLSDFVG